MRLRHYGLRGRAVGAAVDHYRHLPRRAGPGAGPHHGRPLSLLQPGRQPRTSQLREAELSRRAPSEMPTYGNLRQGFVYERVPHITLRDIANNAEIDVIWEEYQEKLEPLREELNAHAGHGTGRVGDSARGR